VSETTSAFYGPHHGLLYSQVCGQASPSLATAASDVVASHDDDDASFLPSK
jgi:hypothetical protein